MGASMQSLLISILLITMLLYSVYGITCYQCDSMLNDKCREDFDSDGIFKADCAKASIPRYLQSYPNQQKNATGCAKITIEDDDKQTIIRSCYYGTIQDDNSTNTSTCVIDPLDIKSRLVSCKTCIENLCNDSTSMRPLIVVVFIAVIPILSQML